ncbi:CoA-transferase [Salipiger aestuarii]|uniref:Formyl-CoA transferase n=1 Tax=Salipiger aestuarii TaxID=568098 RepID=A0A327XRR2_9RHOB|nr:CoA transferase [Salipiger aestuarii]EIE49266.1 acyl-CoA transferase/carnitine dehydrastase [Citreicella sp. 357]KAA8605122.1 CoA-transferase [Salipiger aestuarii]KAA8606971.1 CoA-transferase [Salipiger aestuarii]KAB2535730.1 CoA-transferase [Salipiger aestuarii]RAK08659.1 formyl-CoA transferase [Salipiger aestuarii]
MTQSAEARQGPLSNLRVLEMGQLLAGPFCGQLLADFGAEVIKCEQPGSGDPLRVWGQEKPYGKSLWWPVVGRNKKSLTLNLRTPEGQAIVRDLVRSTDILIENFRPGTMERWNLGYETLRDINPGLIMVRVSGYGQTGPYAARAGYGAIGEAMGGLRYVVGDPSTPPSRMGISIGDELAATYACLGALMALHHRTETGKGQVVDSAIYEAVLAMMESTVSEYDVAGYVRERTGATLPNVSPSNVFPTRDGKMLLIAANQDTVFRRLATAMGRPDLAQDDRYATHSARGENMRALDGLIADWTGTVDLEPLQALLEEHGVPCGLIYSAADMMKDPHFAAREAIVKLPHKDFGSIRMQNVTPRLSESPGKLRHVGPDLGEHTDEILGDLLKVTPERLKELRAGGIV